MKSAVWMASMALTVVACATAPVSFVSTTPEPTDAAYNCAMKKLNELGYTVSNTNKDAGFITGAKQTSSGVGEFMTGKKYHDILTISIFDADEGSRRLRVTAAQSQEAAWFGNASKSGIKPSAAGMAAARAILSTCAKDSIQQVVQVQQKARLD